MKNPTLDPEDWDVFRQQAHAMLDRAIDQMRDSGKGRVWTPAAKSLRDQLRSGLPETPLALSEVVNRLTALLPHGVGNTHPRFLAWVHGAGTPGNILAEMTAAAMNANLGGRDHAAIHVERQVLGWCRELMGFPEDAGGLITSGTSAATVVALKVARDWAAGWETRAAGAASARSLVGYASCEAHNCVARAFDLLGLGTDALRRVPANSERRLDTQALRRTIAEDRASGLRPFLLVRTAGTVNTGAIDDLTLLAEIAEGEALWLHVDGAFGASLMLSESLRGRVAGLERAQSLAFDFHKWMQVNYAAGCVLVRDGDVQLRSFASRPDYLKSGRALAGGAPWPVDSGPELSRGFLALKVWAHFLEHGRARLARVVEMNCEQATWLAGQVASARDMELLAPATLNIVCFRMCPPGCAQLDRLNEDIVAELQESGVAAPSTTQVDGKLAIRVNLTNHRTTQMDLEILLRACREIARRLAQSCGY